MLLAGFVLPAVSGASSTQDLRITSFLNVTVNGSIPQAGGTTSFTSTVTGGDGNYVYSWTCRFHTCPSLGINCSNYATAETTCTFPGQSTYPPFICLSVKDVSVQFSGVYPYMAFGCGNSQLGSIITVTAQSSLAEVSCYRGGAYSGCPPATFSADLPNHVPGVIYDWYFATPNIPGKLPNSGDPVLQGQQVTWNSFSFGTEPWLIFVQACPPPSGQTNALDYDCLGTADHYAEASAVVYPPSPPPGPLSFFQGLWNWLGSIWGGIKNIPSKLGDAIGGTYGCFTPSDNPYFPQLPCNLPQWLRNIPFLTLVGGAVGGGIFYWRSKTKGQ